MTWPYAYTLGSGAQRAIQMALIRLLADIRKTRDQDLARRLLLIDEPEIFLHPQGVRGLREALHVLSKSGYQVVFTTHSPLMVSRDNAPETVIVRRSRENGSEVRIPMGAAVAQAMAEVSTKPGAIHRLDAGYLIPYLAVMLRSGVVWFGEVLPEHE